MKTVYSIKVNDITRGRTFGVMFRDRGDRDFDSIGEALYYLDKATNGFGGWIITVCTNSDGKEVEHPLEFYIEGRLV